MSTQLPGSNPTAYLGISETNPPQLYFFDRAPLATDARPYDKGDIWIDRSVDEAYILTAKIGAVATWIGIGGTGAAETLTGDIGGAVGPDAAENINIVGGTDTSVTGTPGTNTLTINSTAASIDQQQIIYVGKHGNDANDGFTIDKAKLTFGSAITAATAIAPAVVVCFDNGTYVEDIATVATVSIEAENSILTGTIIGVDGTFVNFRTVTTNVGVCISKTAGTGDFIINVETIEATGGADAILCTAGNLFINSTNVIVQNGFGISATTTAHVHLKVTHFIVSGNGTIMEIAVGGEIDGSVDTWFETGGPNGTAIVNSGGSIDIRFTEIETDIGVICNAGITNLIGNHIDPTTSAYDVANGATLNLTVNELTGTETVAAGGIVNIYQNDAGVKTNQIWNIENPETTDNLYNISVAGDATYPQTGALTVNAGATGARPGAPVDGMIRYNSTTNVFEGYENGAWVNFSTGGGTANLVQEVYATTSAFITCGTLLPYDNSIPQQTEGNEVLTLAITPVSATNILLITINCYASGSNGGTAETGSMALFQDATADALAAVGFLEDSGGTLDSVGNGIIQYRMVSGTVAATTFKIRVGPSATPNPIHVNGNAAAVFAGVANTSISILEIQP